MLYREWNFLVHVFSGVLDVDGYRELDDGGIGQRTGMIDGSGKTYWRYDQRGRLRWEDKWIGASDHFITERSYNSADLLAWMKYPGGNGGQPGEQVTYSYHPQMLVKNVFSSIYNYYYLQNATYDAAGRPDQRMLGAANPAAVPLLVQDQDYFAWDKPNGLGRLKALKTQTGGTVDHPPGPALLQRDGYSRL